MELIKRLISSVSTLLLFVRSVGPLRNFIFAKLVLRAAALPVCALCVALASSNSFSTSLASCVYHFDLICAQSSQAMAWQAVLSHLFIRHFVCVCACLRYIHFACVFMCLGASVHVRADWRMEHVQCTYMLIRPNKTIEHDKAVYREENPI